MPILEDMKAATIAMGFEFCHWEIGPGAANALGAAFMHHNIGKPIANGSILYGYEMTLVSGFDGWDLVRDSTRKAG